MAYKRNPEEPQIPQCDWLIFKGQTPRPDRTNIFAWTPHLAARVDEFEEFKGMLPIMKQKKTINEIAEEEVEEVVETLDPKKAKILMLVAAISHLHKEDFTSTGKPRIDSLEAAVDFEVSAIMRDEAYDLYLEGEED